jgi:hypothetical protein
MSFFGAIRNWDLQHLVMSKIIGFLQSPKFHTKVIPAVPLPDAIR